MPRDFTMQIPVLAQASRIGTVDEAARTVEVIFSTGARVEHSMPDSEGRMRRVMTQVVLEDGAAMLGALNNGAPVLDNHDGYSLRSVIGVVERARIDQGVGVATLRFSTAPEAEAIWFKVREGVLRNVSMGFRVHEVQVVMDPERPGEELWRLTKWEPFEISMVPLGADPGARTQAGDAPTCTAVIHHAQEAEMPQNTPPAAPLEVAVPPAAIIAQSAPAPLPAPALPVDIEAIRLQGAETERTRQSAIRAAAPLVMASEALITQAVADGITVNEFRLRALEAFAAQGQAATRGVGGASASVTQDATERFVQGATAGLLTRAGITGGERNEFTGLTLRELARQSLTVAGAGTAFSDPRQMVGAAFVQFGSHGTSDFALILSNIMGKAALLGWEEAEETFDLWTSTGTLTDFKATKRVGLGNFSALDLIEEGGEYSQGTAGERGETVTLATYGKELRITRQAIINDDLQLLAGLPRKMGRAAKRTIGNLVYAVLNGNPDLADGVALFHATHKNLAGSGAAISVASLSAAEAAMMLQTEETGASSTGQALNIMPKYLLVPAAQKRLAMQLMSSPVDPTASRGMATNPVAGMADVISDGRLTGTAWYLAADGSVHDGIEVSYLNGQSEPYIEEAESWSTDGVKLKVRMDAAVAPLDHRTFYKNGGA